MSKAQQRPIACRIEKLLKEVLREWQADVRISVEIGRNPQAYCDYTNLYLRLVLPADWEKQTQRLGTRLVADRLVLSAKRINRKREGLHVCNVADMRNRWLVERCYIASFYGWWGVGLCPQEAFESAKQSMAERLAGGCS